MGIIQDITNIFKTKPKKEQDKADVDRRKKQDALHKAFSDIQQQRLHGIISTLKELSTTEEIKANLKQTRHHKEFEEKVTDIIETYNRKLDHIDPSIKESQKLTVLPIVEAKLKELDKWCEEPIKTDTTLIWKNIGNVIKHSLKAIKNIGNKGYTDEIEKVRYYMKAVKNAQKNTKEAKEEVRGATKPLTAKSTTKKLLESKLQPKKTNPKSKTKQSG
ncbi:MAG TPA: hypothetical protein LFV90_06615 [Rickettsia endosymbiont of Columbicola hoogstraali]|nr:hypothetical protein [Rickettsia endosymbiont of Columbicola hoogstraali]